MLQEDTDSGLGMCLHSPGCRAFCSSALTAWMQSTVLLVCPDLPQLAEHFCHSPSHQLHKEMQKFMIELSTYVGKLQYYIAVEMPRTHTDTHFGAIAILQKLKLHFGATQCVRGQPSCEDVMCSKLPQFVQFKETSKEVPPE